MTWPDVVIGGIALIFALKGFKRGFVAELAGAVALFVAIFAAFSYGGALDDAAARITHTGAGSAHVIGMVAYAAAVYVAVVAAAGLLGRFARLPVINLGNAAAGAVVGAMKALVGCWAVLYVALFFPLSGDLRADLHRSTAVALLTGPNQHVDAALRGAMPWFVRPFVGPLFSHHRV